MVKPKPAYGDMIDLPDDPGMVVQSDEHSGIQSYDRIPIRRALDRKKAARAKAEAKPEPAEYIQRSLYAREETFERIREFAFKSRRPAQELYREGLFLLLKKYGLAEGITKPEDV